MSPNRAELWHIRGGGAGGMGQLVADVTSGPRPAGRRRLLLVLLRSVVALLVLALACGWYVDHRLVGQLGRVHGVFDGLSGRPPAVGATVVLLVIEKPDALAPSSWLPGAGTAVSVQLVEVRHGGRDVQALALPLASSFADGSTVQDVAANRSPGDLVSRVEQASGRRI